MGLCVKGLWFGLVCRFCMNNDRQTAAAAAAIASISSQQTDTADLSCVLVKIWRLRAHHTHTAPARPDIDCNDVGYDVESRQNESWNSYSYRRRYGNDDGDAIDRIVSVTRFAAPCLRREW